MQVRCPSESQRSACDVAAADRPAPQACGALAAALWFGACGIGLSTQGQAGLSEELWRGVLLPLLVAPWAEEILFRAGLQRALRVRCRAVVANGWTACAFGLAHAGVAALVMQAPGAAALLLAAATALPALAIGWVYELTGRLLPCMALHATMNLLLWRAIGVLS